MIYVVTRRLLAYYYADPVICYAFLVTMVGPITIVSTHSRPTSRLPVFILQTFYVCDVIFCIIIRTNKHLLDYVTSTQIMLFTCIHYAYLSYTLDTNTMYPQVYVIQCYVGLHVMTLTSSAVNYLTFPDTLLSQCVTNIPAFTPILYYIILLCLIVYRTCMTYCNFLSRNNAVVVFTRQGTSTHLLQSICQDRSNHPTSPLSPDLFCIDKAVKTDA